MHKIVVRGDIVQDILLADFGWVDVGQGGYCPGGLCPDTMQVDTFKFSWETQIIHQSVTYIYIPGSALSSLNCSKAFSKFINLFKNKS